MNTLRHWLLMIVLSFSGGAIFLLPFLFEFYFIPLQTALDLNKTQVGMLMGTFGVTAMLAYFPGGWLADRVQARVLLSIGGVATGLAGLYFATFPPFHISIALHAFWGISVTMIFWGAMLKATRQWGTSDEQGKAFGILECGRGFGEMVPTTLLLAVFAYLGSTSFALSQVIIGTASLNIVLGILSWWVFPAESQPDKDSTGNAQAAVGLAEILAVIRMPAVWLIAIVIMSAYSAYWGTLLFTGYVTEVLMMSVAVAGFVSAARGWLKPVAALVGGLVADRIGITRSVVICMSVVTMSFLLFAILPGGPSLLIPILINLFIVGITTLALRGIYFAMLEEARIPIALSGTAFGLISALAYTPDIYMPLLNGVLLDNFPGLTGYRLLFISVAAMSTVGIVAALLFQRLTRKNDV